MSLTWAVLDHWVVDFSGLDDFYIKQQALMAFIEHIESQAHHLRVLPFLNAQYWQDIYSRLADSQHQYPVRLSDLDLGHETTVAELQDLPLEDCWGECVRRVLDADDAPCWRDPVVFAPRCRVVGQWSGEHEIELKAGVFRVLVDLDEPSANPHYLADFDPWKCERSRGGAGDVCVRDLPRPPACENTGLHEWNARLAELSDATNGTHVYFVPESGWEPTSIIKDTWRRHPFGERCSKDVERRGVKSGPRDRRGRIWDWDDTHNTHWDVQHESEHDHSYMNVRPDGLITKR